MRNQYWVIEPLQDEGGGWNETPGLKTRSLVKAQAYLLKAKHIEEGYREAWLKDCKTDIETKEFMDNYYAEGGFVPYLILVQKL